ncbi:MAG: PDZ domain-containing protein, partial [Phycisphaerae bacterium]|nr:PDZ domain-containing protein [Gemmatimonadaceae bacterium]
MKTSNEWNLLAAAQRARVCTTAAASAMLLMMNPLSNQASAQDSRAREETFARILPRVERLGFPEFASMLRPDTKRAVIGVTTSGSAHSDTLGVLITHVDAGSPAEKAGIKQGSRITAINGVSLRIAREDAADPELEGLGQRRLSREMTKAAPGDDVELSVLTGSNTQTFKVKTVSAAELYDSPMNSGTYVRSGDGVEKRASLGVSIGSTGNPRDTLGLFISSVITDGPAEQAGVFEGDRIAAINGVDVRVPREDAEDAQSSVARVNRFTRELAKLAPGDKVTLRVYGGGRYREV